MSNGSQPYRVHRLADLAQLSTCRPGDVAWVAEDNRVYWALGNMAPNIREAISWPHANVWMPDHVLTNLVVTRVRVFRSSVLVGARILESPQSVHRDLLRDDCLYLFADGEDLRRRGVLLSQSTPYVDAVIELRAIEGHVLPRMFHLSPRKRNRGGEQLWP